MSTFRNPPLFSVATPLAAVMAIGRTLGASQWTLETILRQAVGKNQKQKVFADYVPSNADVFIPVYSKSGTNWIMQITQQIACKGQAEFGHIHELVAWPDAIFPGITRLNDLTHARAAESGLRMIKTGLESEYVPYSPDAKYISVLRDPKAIFVSGYHFVTGLFGMGSQISMTQWLDKFLSPEFIGGSWAYHTAGYWTWRDRPNVLILNFDDMKRDLNTAVARCAELMGVELNENEQNEIVRRADFEYMKTQAEKFNPPRFRFVPEAKRSVMLRTGSAQAGNELTDDQADRIDSYMETELETLNCDLPYAEMFRR